MELKFYYCEDCGNLMILLKNSGVDYELRTTVVRSS